KNDGDAWHGLSAVLVTAKSLQIWGRRPRPGDGEERQIARRVNARKPQRRVRAAASAASTIASPTRMRSSAENGGWRRRDCDGWVRRNAGTCTKATRRGAPA